MSKKLIYSFVGLVVVIISAIIINSNSSTRSSCAFCDSQVLNAQKFYEDDLVLALYTHKPIFPGHCLIIPKRHLERFEMLSDEEALRMNQVIKKVDQTVSKVFGTSSYLLLQKNGSEVGQTVPHVHFHYIPRKAGEDSSIKFLLRMYLVNALRPIKPQEMQEIVEKIKQELEGKASF